MKRLALVTGASSGIGESFAMKLGAGGYDLILVARREERLATLSEALQQRHGTVAEILPADLASEDGLEIVCRRIHEASNLDLLVNNAGFGTAGYFFRKDAVSQIEMHRLHVLATLRLTHAALPGMIDRKTGAVINVSSVAGFWQAPGSVSYCATKTWMNSFTKGLALELRSIGSPVKVQSLCPGFTVSEFHDRAGIDRKAVPRRLWMTADEVVEESLRELESGKLFVVPGWRYRALVFAMKHLPGGLLDRAALRQRRGLANQSA
jgi:short-subunit dehydrogenase